MPTLLANRVQSAYSRPSYRPGTDGQNAHLGQRPTTSAGTHQPFTNIYDQDTLKTFEPTTFSSPPPSSHRRRAKTASICSTTTSVRSASRKLRSEEIERLVKSLERNDTYIVKVDCLAEYRTLVDTIDLRRTPMDCQLLCALQQRENRIVQRNACHDLRFRSLVETLEPVHLPEDNIQNDSNDANRTTISEYPPSDLPYEYIK